jgi:hypothetical protein
MAVARATPIVIGVGDVVNRSRKVEDAIEPLQLMLQAIKLALNDTSLSGSATKELQAQIDSLDVVGSWTWPYTDLPTILSENLGVSPQRKYYSQIGGHHAGKLFNEAAQRISMRETKVAVLTGGEALASCKSPSTVRYG